MGPDRSMHLGTGVLDIDTTDGGGVSDTQHITFPDGLMRSLDVNKTQDRRKQTSFGAASESDECDRADGTESEFFENDRG